MTAQAASLADSEGSASLSLEASMKMMLASMTAVIFAFALVIFTPPAFGLTACVIIYSLVVLQELRNRVFAPTSIIVLCVYSGFASLLWAGVDPNTWLHLIGLVLFGTLAVVTGSMLAFGIPFTTVYSRGSGLVSLHWFSSGMWVLAFTTAALTSWFLQPSVWFVLAPLIIIFTAVAGIVTVSFFYFGPKYQRQKKFSIGGLTFEEVPPTDENIKTFFTIIAEEFMPVIKKDKKTKKLNITIEQLRDNFIENDDDFRDHSTYFFAKDGDQTIGVICYIHDNRRSGFQLEKHAGLDLNGLRKLGRVAEMDLISITERYRMRSDAFTGLVKCGLDMAHEQCVDFLCIDSFPTRQGLYKKVGFVNMTDKPYVAGEDHLGYSMPMQPMVVNMSETLATAAEDRRGSADALGQVLNLYLAERAAKRLIVRQLFSFWKTPVWKLSSEEIRAAITSKN